MKTIALFLTLLIPALALAEVEPLSTPSPNVGTITPTAIVAETGSFSGSVTASSVTTFGDARVNGIAGIGGAPTVGYDFTVNNTAANAIRITADAGYEINFAGAAGANIYHSEANQPIFFGTNAGDVNIGNSDGGAKLVVDGPTGYVGVGTAAPATDLTVIGGGGLSVASSGTGSDADGRMRFTRSDTYAAIDNYKTATGYGVIAIYSSGLGLDTITPATKLDVNGNAQFGSGATKSTFTATGALTLDAAAAITARGGVITGIGSGVNNVGITLSGSGGTGGANAHHIWDSGSLNVMYFDEWTGSFRFRDAASSYANVFEINSTGFKPYGKTKAQIDVLVPASTGEYIHCTDCALPGLCVSTGTAAAQWRKMESATLGCGTNN